jgi:hypothetical protein
VCPTQGRHIDVRSGLLRELLEELQQLEKEGLALDAEIAATLPLGDAALRQARLDMERVSLQGFHALLHGSS